MWTHEKEIKLSYLRLLSREGGLTQSLREEKDQLEEDFETLGFGRFPGGIEYIRYCLEQRESVFESSGCIEGLDYIDPVHSSPSSAALLGRKGGKAKTEAKTQAARANGRKGGRPRVEIDWSLE